MRLSNVDDRINVYDGNKIVAYVENDTLYMFDKKGYAIERATIDRPQEIISKYLSLRLIDVSRAIK